jgi:hypothetical protein
MARALADDSVGCVFDCLLEVILVENGGAAFRFREKPRESRGKFLLT